MNATLPLFAEPTPSDVSPIDLWPYQVDALTALDRAFAAGKQSLLLVMPTGAGKMIVGTELIRRVTRDGGRAYFLAPRRELVMQACAKLERASIAHGILLAGLDHYRNPYACAQVASVDTLLSRMIRRKHLVLPDPDLVIVDEAHLSITEARKALLALWPNARRIGLTATPTRKDGRALGQLYDVLIEPCSVAELTPRYLVPARYFAPTEPDLERVRILAGEYNAKDLDGAMNRIELIGDVVTHWLAHAPGRRTVVFCCSIDHSAAMATAFMRAGVAAEHVDTNTPQRLRDETFGRFISGDTQILTNCQLATYGFDLPELSCVVLARPTRSLMLYLQMIGRGLRIAPGKSDCLVLDHSGCVHRFGFAADERIWTLEGNHALVEKSAPSRGRSASESRDLTCPECQAIFARARVCPECSYYFAPRGTHVETLDGQLIEIGDGLEADEQARLAFFCELRGYGVERGWKHGAAAHRYRDRFGAWPPREWNSMQPTQPSLATRRWVLSRQIAFSRARKSAERVHPQQ